MKRKILIAFMVVFAILSAVNLFNSLICGAPAGGAEQGRYLIGAVGTSVLFPAGFTFFFLTTLFLSEKLRESEEAAVTAEEREKEEVMNTLEEVQVPILVNAIAKKQNLTEEEEKSIISFIEDL